MSDWADDKAVETLKAILSPARTIDDATELLAAIFRVVEATGAQRGIEAAADGVRKAFVP